MLAIGDPDYLDPALQGLSPAQIDAHLVWQYQRRKSNYRKHFRKPTRKVRKFMKSKCKGKGKGANIFGFLTAMTDQEYSDLFYGGRPFVRRSSGRGKGRRKNLRNRNRDIMTCDKCGAEDHFRAQCPRRGQQ